MLLHLALAAAAATLESVDAQHQLFQPPIFSPCLFPVPSDEDVSPPPSNPRDTGLSPGAPAGVAQKLKNSTKNVHFVTFFCATFFPSKNKTKTMQKF